MARTKTGACVLLSLCVAFATRMFAAPLSPTGDVGTATWPDHGPYQKVGRYDSGLEAKLPVPLVAAVRRVVPAVPSLWGLYPGLHDFAGHGWPILQLYGEDSGYVTLLQARGSWTILGAPASLPILNEVLDPLGPADLRDRAKLENYLWHVVLLQKHGEGDFLDERFRREQVDNPLSPSRYELWTDGTKKQHRELRALCHDPIMAQSGSEWKVRLNVITGRGAVEQWTFHLRVDQRVQLESTEVRQLLKQGAFFYPLM